MALRKVLVIFLFILTLSACKENLYTGLTEKDVNVMIAILDRNGISTEKRKEDKNRYSLLVDTSDFTRSVKILSSAGYPRHEYKSIEDIFNNESIVKTPFEQRARFVYALNQEIARSISEIEGVISARVHITLPRETRFGKPKEKARAGVVVIYVPERSVVRLRPKIKKLIAHSVSGLRYEDVTVIMSASDNLEKKLGGQNGEHIVSNKIAEAIKAFNPETLTSVKQENQNFPSYYSIILILLGVAMSIAAVYLTLNRRS